MLKEKIWASFQRIVELFTQKFVIKLSKILVWDLGSEIRKKPISDPGSGSRGQKGTGSRIRIGNTGFVFDLLISVLNIWKDFKVLSRFIQKWIQHPACLDPGLYRILSSYWLAHFYLMKKSAKVLHYFCLDCGMLEFFKNSTPEP